MARDSQKSPVIFMSDPEPVRTEPEIVRIREEDYQRMVADARQIQADTDALHSVSCCQFRDRNNFPTEEDLITHDVRHHFREYLPYLVYYHDVFTTEDPSWGDARKALDQLFGECLDIVAAQDYQPIENEEPAHWKARTDLEKAALLRPLIWYYGSNEFETFLRDLGWQAWMKTYRYSVRMRKHGQRCPVLEQELRRIWDQVQNEPLSDISARG